MPALLYQSGDIACNILEPTLGLLQLSDLILGVEIHFDFEVSELCHFNCFNRRTSVYHKLFTYDAPFKM